MSPYAFYYVTDERLSIEENIDLIERCAPSLTMVQLREKNTPSTRRLKHAKQLKRILDKHNLPFIINDDLNVAIECQADGLHIGQSDGDVVSIRAALGKHKYLGLTVETPSQLLTAQTLPVDYLGISSVFATQTKQDIQSIWGLKGLAWAIEHSQKPLVAIGGITSDNITNILKSDCEGIAVISALSQASSPETLLQTWQKILTTK